MSDIRSVLIACAAVGGALLLGVLWTEYAFDRGVQAGYHACMEE